MTYQFGSRVCSLNMLQDVGPFIKPLPGIQSYSQPNTRNSSNFTLQFWVWRENALGRSAEVLIDAAALMRRWIRPLPLAGWLLFRNFVR